MAAYFVDLIGALFGSLGIIWYCNRRYPYCDRCRLFKKRADKYDFIIDDKENLAVNILSEIKDIIGKGICENFISHCVHLCEQYHGKSGNTEITIDMRFCPKCEEVSVVVYVHRLSSGEWVEEKKLGFNMTLLPLTQQEMPEQSS